MTTPDASLLLLSNHQNPVLWRPMDKWCPLWWRPSASTPSFPLQQLLTRSSQNCVTKNIRSSLPNAGRMTTSPALTTEKSFWLPASRGMYLSKDVPREFSERSLPYTKLLKITIDSRIMDDLVGHPYGLVRIPTPRLVSYCNGSFYSPAEPYRDNTKIRMYLRYSIATKTESVSAEYSGFQPTNRALRIF